MTHPRFLSFPSLHHFAGKSVLIVDDVWDSGRTAQAVRERVQRANPKALAIAVLHFKPHNNSFKDKEPEFYASTADKWVVYPWERASPTINAEFRQKPSRNKKSP